MPKTKNRKWYQSISRDWLLFGITFLTFVVTTLNIGISTLHIRDDVRIVFSPMPSVQFRKAQNSELEASSDIGRELLKFMSQRGEVWLGVVTNELSVTVINSGNRAVAITAIEVDFDVSELDNNKKKISGRAFSREYLFEPIVVQPAKIIIRKLKVERDSQLEKMIPTAIVRVKDGSVDFLTTVTVTYSAHSDSGKANFSFPKSQNWSGPLINIGVGMISAADVNSKPLSVIRSSRWIF